MDRVRIQEKNATLLDLFSQALRPEHKGLKIQIGLFTGKEALRLVPVVAEPDQTQIQEKAFVDSKERCESEHVHFQRSHC